MKPLCLSIFYIVFLSTVTKGQHHPNVNDSITTKKIITMADAIGKQFIPDKRTAIFQILTDSSGKSILETTEPEVAQKLNDTLVKSGLHKIPTQLLPSGSLGSNTFALVNLSVVNVRSNPRNAAELATQALLGTPLDLLKKEGYYYLVRTPDRYIAWLDAGAISLKTASDMDLWKQQEKLVFKDDYGHAFLYADRKSERVSDLVMGDILVKLGIVKDFYKVRFPDNRVGFVPKEHMLAYEKWINLPAPKAEQVLAVAKTMIGVPYLWGGTSVKGVDCSGFTKTAFFMNGIVIPRDASQQALVGMPVPVLKNDTLNLDEALNNLKSGDLIFFASGSNRPLTARVTHVAMYIGNGEFIHAAGRVRINSMKPDAANYEDFKTRTVVGARRYIGQFGQQDIVPVVQHKSYQRIP